MGWKNKGQKHSCVISSKAVGSGLGQTVPSLRKHLLCAGGTPVHPTREGAATVPGSQRTARPAWGSSLGQGQVVGHHGTAGPALPNGDTCTHVGLGRPHVSGLIICDIVKRETPQ